MGNPYLATWLSQRLKQDATGSVPFRALLQFSGARSKRHLYILLKVLYPLTKVKKKRICGTQRAMTVYTGISMAANEEVVSCTLEELVSFIPADVLLITSSPEQIEIGIGTRLLVNGNMVMKRVEFCVGNWNLYVRNSRVKLDKLGISDEFTCSKSNFLSVIELVKKISICRGTSIPISRETIPPYFIEEPVESEWSTGSEHRMRSRYCDQACLWGSVTNVCRICQCLPNFGVSVPDASEEDISKELQEKIDACFPHAPPEMKDLMRAQHAALKAKIPQSRRWDRSFIGLCLSLFAKSPKAYRDLQESKLLVLPSGRQLSRYKKKIPCTGDMQQSIMHWIRESAESGSGAANKEVNTASSQSARHVPSGSIVTTGSRRKKKQMKSKAESNRPEPMEIEGRCMEPKTPEWPCAECHNECFSGCVWCDACDQWRHYGCLGLSGDEKELQEDKWFCPRCTKKSNRPEPMEIKGKGMEPNTPGRPCAECHNECSGGCVWCGACDQWRHYGCLGLSGDEKELQEDKWFCPRCSKKSNRPDPMEIEGKSRKPKTPEWPCAECRTECSGGCVWCNACDQWRHYGCLGLSGDEKELQQDKWFCPRCTKD